jgi:excinuclease ABC subunit C
MIRSIAENVPPRCGVYVFRGSGGRALYIGKSVNLRRRMLEHLRTGRNEPRGPVRRLAFEIEEFSFVETETELLALLLEDRLIKEHLPEHNTRQRKYLEYRYLCLTDVDFPNLRVIARTDQAPPGTLFGPFRDRYLTRRVQGIAEDVLRLRACPELHPDRKSARYDLGQCTGPCRGAILKVDYGRIVEKVIDFLDGDSTIVVGELTKRMEAAVAAGRYETAAELKRGVGFCRRFCTRQTFLRDFRDRTLIVRVSGGRQSYVFERGRLTRWKGIPQGGPGKEGPEDARFILDRGNIVYDWVLRHRGRCECRVRISPGMARSKRRIHS